MPTLLAAVVGGLLGGATVHYLGSPAGPLPTGRRIQPLTQVVETGPPAALGEPVVQVVRKVGPAVVNIDTLASVRSPSAFPGFFGQVPEQQRGQGSGFLINREERLVVTNHHVIASANRIRVTFSDKRAFQADVIGSDPISDIALLRLQGTEPLPDPVEFGDSDKLEIGQLTVAIGAPLGLQNTVTQGVLSAIGRQLDGHIRGIPLDDLIQTDTAINPGNSGGPLLDGQGRVIGVNTAILSQAQGIGFSVAANTVMKAVTDLLQHGRVIRPWVGVSMGDLNREIARELNVPSPSGDGVVIAEVRPGEPADRAGMRQGDVITEANGKAVRNGEELRAVIRGVTPGETLEVRGFRGQEGMTWKIKIGEMPPPERLG